MDRISSLLTLISFGNRPIKEITAEGNSAVDLGHSRVLKIPQVRQLWTSM
jgi:hypothetical protein